MTNVKTKGAQTKSVVPLDDGQVTLATVGGKGANLAKLARAGFPVPGGFLVTTAAYQTFVTTNHIDDAIRGALQGIQMDDPAALARASAQIRQAFRAGVVPDELTLALWEAYENLDQSPVAVRSSATAEDLPEMSFAGQQDTYLNIVGDDALLEAVVNCWGSLWTARAIGYRSRNSIDHGEVALAVVVQTMVQSEVSGGPLYGQSIDRQPHRNRNRCHLWSGRSACLWPSRAGSLYCREQHRPYCAKNLGGQSVDHSRAKRGRYRHPAS